MARRVDENKLISIKKATIESVVMDGISGASISKIADKANVSVGYLYRFYTGKRELIEALFAERFNMIQSLLEEQVTSLKSVKEILHVFVKTIFDSSKVDPQSICFTFKLLSDFSFDFPENFKENVNNICSQILKIGRKTGEIDKDIDNEILYTLIVAGLFNFINIRSRAIFKDEPLDEEDIDKTVYLLLKTLAPA